MAEDLPPICNRCNVKTKTATITCDYLPSNKVNCSKIMVLIVSSNWFFLFLVGRHAIPTGVVDAATCVYDWKIDNHTSKRAFPCVRAYTLSALRARLTNGSAPCLGTLSRRQDLRYSVGFVIASIVRTFGSILLFLTGGIHVG